WLDLATREVVGYAMADHHRAELVVVDALDTATAGADSSPAAWFTAIATAKVDSASRRSTSTAEA
ncbi:hypothetical protein ACIP98_39375, partial [Streptomyces sp. NPDC088354]|uniref:hypothetical protein n=1 Tax=Streptomyces sp. NPDC088354 TaxID=3365856 RepID=UPI0038167257